MWFHAAAIHLNYVVNDSQKILVQKCNRGEPKLLADLRLSEPDTNKRLESKPNSLSN